MRVALAPSYLARAVANGVKGDDDYRGPRQKGAPCDLNRLGEAILSLASLNIQKSLKHSNTRRRKALMGYRLLVRSFWCTRREPRLTDSNPEPSSPLPSPASERTNTNCSLNMQTEKDVKEPNSANMCGVLWHRARAEGRVSKSLNTEFDSSTKWCQNTRLGEYPRKNCWLCLKWK